MPTRMLRSKGINTKEPERIMTTTLKLDWTAQRIDHVLTALISTLGPLDMYVVWFDLEPYLGVADPGATLKLTWSPELIDAATEALDTYLAGSQVAIDRARGNWPCSRPGSHELLVAIQTGVHAAVREIREYRAAVAAVIAERGE